MWNQSCVQVSSECLQFWYKIKGTNLFYVKSSFYAKMRGGYMQITHNTATKLFNFQRIRTDEWQQKSVVSSHVSEVFFLSFGFFLFAYETNKKNNIVTIVNAHKVFKIAQKSSHSHSMVFISLFRWRSYLAMRSISGRIYENFMMLLRNGFFSFSQFFFARLNVMCVCVF